MATAVAGVATAPPVVFEGIVGFRKVLQWYNDSGKALKQKDLEEEFLKILKTSEGYVEEEWDEKRIQEALSALQKLSRVLDLELNSSSTIRSCTFNIINETKNHVVMLKQHPTEHGYFVKNNNELDPIKPKERALFRFEKSGGFYGCAGVLTLSLQCKCDRCTDEREFVVAIAFRNLMVQIAKKSKNKFAVKFMDENLEVNESTYGTMIDGENSQLASTGTMTKRYKHVTLSIHMGTEHNVLCDVKIEENDH